MSAVRRSGGGPLAIALVQAMLVMTWTVYVLFLPQLTARAGIPAHWNIWILVADQAIFVVTDWAAAVYADALQRIGASLGLAIAVAAVLAAGALFALPVLADAGHPTPLLVAIAFWAVVSSFLRAPLLALLGRVGGGARKSPVVAVALGGVAVAGALGPLLTSTLQRFDARWGIGLASLALAIAGIFASRHAGRLAGVVAESAARLAAWRAVLAAGAALFVAAFGMQLHTALGAAALPVGPLKTFWLPLFWTGFALGLWPAARVKESDRALRACALAALAGAVAIALLDHAGGFVPRAALLLASGAAWSVVLTGVLAATLERGSRPGLASPVGLLMSVLALAALTRLLLVALGQHTGLDVRGAAALAWALAALALFAHPWRTRVGGA